MTSAATRQHFCSGRGALVNDPLRASGRGMSAPSILHMDPPEHAAFRGLVNRRFTPRALAGLGESIRKSAASLLDTVEPRQEIDFVAELAAPFPLTVIAELLGIDEADREDFRRWSDAAIESPDLPPDETAAALGELSGFIVEHIRAKRDRPGEDLVSLLVGSEVGGCPLSREELFMFLLTLLVAGNETTRTLLSGSALVLHEHPDQRAALAADADLVPGGVEECLRWVTPVHAFCRTATEDVVVAGTAVGEGDYLCMLYASANRDERVFGDDADRFDVRRPTQPDAPGVRVRGARVPGRQPGPAGGSDLRGGVPGAVPRLRGDGLARAGALDHGGGHPVAAGRAGARRRRRDPDPVRPPRRTARRTSPRSASTAAGSAVSRSRPADPFRSDEPALAQHLDVHADGGLGQPEEHGELADRARRGGQGVEQGQAGGLGHRLEALGHRLGPGAGHDVALSDAGPDHDEARELEVHARAEEQAGHEEERQLPGLHA